jgi:hypothetical protein
MVTLELTYKWTFGRDGIDNNPSIPLTRALRNLLENGKPQYRPACCFFDPEYSAGNGEGVRWLGVFVQTAGDRILFFPGFFRTNKGYHLSGRKILKDNDFIIDHVTLDKGFRDIHATMHTPKQPVSVGKPKSIGEGRYFWFGVSIQNLAGLRPVAKETIIRAEIPKTDASRRAKLLEELQGKSLSDLCTRLPAGSMEMFSTGFLHVAVYIGPPGFSEEHWRTSPLGIPSGSKSFAILPSARFDLRQLPLRAHKIKISEQYEVQLATMWLPGSLNVPASFTYF